jgi:hypothetical protein
MKKPEELIYEALTVQEGMLKGASLTPTRERIKQLMLDYNAQFKLDVPTEEEIKKKFPTHKIFINWRDNKYRQEGAKWAKSEIEREINEKAT